MEICSHLLSEINLEDFIEEESTAVMPHSPHLLPIDVPSEITLNMESFTLEF
jgi:hypothetical protein